MLADPRQLRAALIVQALLAMGCGGAPPAPEAPAKPSPMLREERLGPYVLSGEIVGDLVTVHVRQRKECREVSEDRAYRGSWSACGVKPAPAVDLVLTLGPREVGGSPQQLQATSGSDADAKFDLSGVRTVQDTAQLSVASGTANPVEIPLRDTPMRKASAREAIDRTWAREVAKDRASETASIEAMEADITRLERAPVPWPRSDARQMVEHGRLLKELYDRRLEAKTEDPKLDKLFERWRALRAGPLQRSLDAHDDAAWAAARDKCNAATDISDCYGLDQYAREFPGGRHQKELKLIMESAHFKELTQRENARLKKLAERCTTCLSACRGSGAEDSECRSRCSDYCSSF
jgi:hypothetical protein